MPDDGLDVTPSDLICYHNFPLRQMKKPRRRELRNLAEGRGASRWQTWASNTGCQLARLPCRPPPQEETGLRLCWVSKWIVNRSTERFQETLQACEVPAAPQTWRACVRVCLFRAVPEATETYSSPCPTVAGGRGGPVPVTLPTAAVSEPPGLTCLWSPRHVTGAPAGFTRVQRCFACVHAGPFSLPPHPLGAPC